MAFLIGFPHESESTLLTVEKPCGGFERAHRFWVKWTFKVKGRNSAGLNFEEMGVLENLSSSGALFSLKTPLDIGAKLDISIELPFNKERWMEYSARVVRIVSISSIPKVAVAFDSVQPRFADKPLASSSAVGRNQTAFPSLSEQGKGC